MSALCAGAVLVHPALAPAFTQHMPAQPWHCPPAMLPCRCRLPLRQPFGLYYTSPATLALGAGMAAPLAFTALSRARYTGAARVPLAGASCSCLAARCGALGLLQAASCSIPNADRTTASPAPARSMAGHVPGCLPVVRRCVCLRGRHPRDCGAPPCTGPDRLPAVLPCQVQYQPSLVPLVEAAAQSMLPPCLPPTLQVHLPAERLGHWLPFWRLSGAESLLATAMGFLLGQHKHLLVQCATLAVALASLPAMCAQVRRPVCARLAAAHAAAEPAVQAGPLPLHLHLCTSC